MAVIKKEAITSLGEDVEKQGPSYIVDGNVKWNSYQLYFNLKKN